MHSSSLRRRGVLVAATFMISGIVACSSSHATNNGGGNGGGNGGSTNADVGGSDPSTLAACDPLVASSVALPTIIGVGKDAKGVLYVAAGESLAGVRVFVVESGALHEQQIPGSGLSGTDFNVTFADVGATNASWRNLLGHVVNGKATEMALGSPTTKGNIGDPSESGDETLTLQAESAIANITAIGLPLQPEEVAKTDDGWGLVVLRSEITSGPGLRVFYGKDGALIERKVTATGAEAEDSGVGFDVDGAAYWANFHYQPGSKSEGGAIITGGLATPNGVQTLTMLTSPSELGPESFQCFSP